MVSIMRFYTNSAVEEKYNMAYEIESGSATITKTIFYAGDSTVQFNSIATYPQTGLGQVLPLFLKENILVKNHGKNGRSTKSFIAEGRLKNIEDKICCGDYLFIEFGHNDEKETDLSRYTDPNTEYKDNLRKFIEVANQKGGFPVLITPLERSNFVNGHLYAGKHVPYVKAMKEVAGECNVPIIDLNAKSRALMEELGEEKSHALFNKDTTHMNYEGAITFGRLLAQGISELGGEYLQMLVEEVLCDEKL